MRGGDAALPLSLNIMATGFLFLLDDIASMLDDVAMLTKLAMRKSAGVVGDDIAVNANAVLGMHAHRELPIVLAVAFGSALNKLILIPLAMALSLFAPWLLTPILLLGALYLCHEGAAKVADWLLHARKPQAADHPEQDVKAQALAQSSLLTENEIVALEQTRIRGAIRTDFILSAEIVVLTLSWVADASLLEQFLVLVGVSTIMTISVYGLVAFIVKLDDVGIWLEEATPYTVLRLIGGALLGLAPLLMRLLTAVGTVALFLVGGGIVVHAFDSLSAWGVAMAVPHAMWHGMVGALVGALGVALLHFLRRKNTR